MRASFVGCVLAASFFHMVAEGSELDGGLQQDFAAALVPSCQTPTPEANVSVARFSAICGRHRNVCGLDVGLIGNLVDEGVVGFGFSGVFSVVGRSRSAFLLTGAWNDVGGDLVGLQVSGGVDRVRGRLVGVQIGSVNLAEDLCGTQIGIFNKARRGTGFQLGGVNTSERFTGVQIGIINLNIESSVPMVPIFNCYF